MYFDGVSLHVVEQAETEGEGGDEGEVRER